MNDPTNLNPSDFGSIDFMTPEGQQEIARTLNRLSSERDALIEKLESICDTWGEPANSGGPSLSRIIENARALLSRLDAGKG